MTDSQSDADFIRAKQCFGSGKLDEAEAVLKTILTRNPNHFEATEGLAVLYATQENLTAAIPMFEEAAKLRPEKAGVHFNLGSALTEVGRLEEAIAAFHQCLRIDPNGEPIHINLGNAYKEFGDLDSAAASFRRAIEINPVSAIAHNNLASTLRLIGDLPSAIACFEKTLKLAADFSGGHSNSFSVNLDLADVHFNLGIALQDLARFEDAAANYHKAIAVNPDLAGAHHNLGCALKNLGQLEDALASLRKAIVIKPDYFEAHCNLLLSEQYWPGHNAESLFKLHCAWEEQHGRAFRSDWPAHENSPDADRRLRVGFVSPDLGHHPVGYFVVSVLENLPRDEIETFCYSDRIGDGLTERIKAAADVWHDTEEASDEDLSQLIAGDQIDILIDLTGHSAGSRLLVFARKPAPLQVAWAGYVGTTGLSAIDYLISDMYSTGEEDEPYYSEEIIRMPDGWLCYDPPDYAPEVGPLPFKKNDHITFCSFSNPAKINEGLVSVWAKILHQVASARLLIKYKGIDSTSNIDRLVAMFEAEGVDQSRLILEGLSPHAELLARYNDVDITLDPFPYSGGLTTYESLWMGVPVITVPGDTFASRHSLSHLSTVGLPELVARDTDDYVTLAVELANDIDRLADLRAGLRDRMSSSPLCNGEKFAVGFAKLMRDIWRKWCVSRNNNH